VHERDRACVGRAVRGSRHRHRAEPDPGGIAQALVGQALDRHRLRARVAVLEPQDQARTIVEPERSLAIEAAPGNGARGLVLSGGEKVFSGGLDVPYLMGLDRNGLAACWTRFFAAARALAPSPIPVRSAPWLPERSRWR